MDLGKILADAMSEAGSLTNADCDSDNPSHVWYEGLYDLKAAAEAFLAKVRGAQKASQQSADAENGIRIYQHARDLPQQEGVTYGPTRYLYIEGNDGSSSSFARSYAGVDRVIVPATSVSIRDDTET